ncbi:MAG: hypothetical protein IT159_13170 [Bryobacterales bacterium]|nr:hypothetical protein [Bryobacterales bacterium]
MKLKSFFAGSVEAALGLAREELGSEAVLVNSRQAPPEARHMGEYEVVAAWLPEEAPGPAASHTETRAGNTLPGRAGAAPGADDRFWREIAELRAEMEKMRRAVWRGACPDTPAGRTRAETAAMLADADVDPQLAHEIAACVEARMNGDPLLEEAAGEEAGAAGARGGETLRDSLTAEMARRVTVDATLGKPEAATRVVALVGPAGAGKTTTLAKLAVLGGLNQRRRVQILSLDTYRIAAAEPLRTYAALLGVGLQSVPTGPALASALEEFQHRDLILIDTPGFGPCDTDAAAEVAGALASRPEIDTHLVLPATMKSADLTSAVDRFEIFRPSKMLFTRVDETSSLGTAYSQAARTARPVSFLSAGQRVPEDVEEATGPRLVQLVLQGLRI